MSEGDRDSERVREGKGAAGGGGGGVCVCGGGHLSASVRNTRMQSAQPVDAVDVYCIRKVERRSCGKVAVDVLEDLRK